MSTSTGVSSYTTNPTAATSYYSTSANTMTMFASNEKEEEVPNYVGSSGIKEEGSTSSSKQEQEEESSDVEKQNLVSKVTRGFQSWRNRPHHDLSPQQQRNKTILIATIVFVVVCVGIGVLIASLKKVDETEYGVEYNKYKKQLDDAAKSGGLFVGPPGYQFIKFPSTYVTVELDDRTCVSRDGLRVVFSVHFQYRMTKDNMLPAILKYRNFEKWAEVVEEAGLSAVHHSCSEFNISTFQSLRGEIQNTMEANLKIKLEGDPTQDPPVEGVYAVAVSLQLRNLALPDEYKLAVAEKQSAEEDIALAQNQRRQELTKANTQLLTAQEEARKILDTAINEAEVMLTEARLKAEETTFAFEKEAETIVSVKNALNLTTEGILAFLANNLVAEAQKLKITTGEPARLSRKDEL